MSVLRIPVAGPYPFDLALTARTRRLLLRAGLLDLGEVVSFTSRYALRTVKGLGPTGVAEVRGWTERYGVSTWPEPLPRTKENRRRWRAQDAVRARCEPWRRPGKR